MLPRFLPLSTLHDLDDALAASMAGPVLLFKHSPTCGTSAMANEELTHVLEEAALPIYRLTAREVRARFDEASHRPSAVSSPA